MIVYSQPVGDWLLGVTGYFNVGFIFSSGARFTSQLRFYFLGMFIYMLPSGCSPDLNIWTLIVRTQVNPFLRIGFTGWFWTKHLQHFHHPHLKSVVIFKIQIVTMGNATHAVPGDSLWLGGLGERTVSLWVCCYREFKRLDKRKKVKLNQQKNYKKTHFSYFFFYTSCISAAAHETVNNYWNSHRLSS